MYPRALCMYGACELCFATNNVSVNLAFPHKGLTKGADYVIAENNVVGLLPSPRVERRAV